MARTDPQVNIRLPENLKDNLEQEARAAGRSLTAEIVQRLEKSFDQPADLIEMGMSSGQRIGSLSMRVEMLEEENAALRKARAAVEMSMMEKLERMHRELVDAAERLAKADPKFAAQQEMLKKQAKAAAKNPRRM